MKIAFVTSEYPHPKVNRSAGIGSSIYNLSAGLIKEGHGVVVIIYGQDRNEIIPLEGITLYKIKSIKFKGLSLLLTQLKVSKLINDLYNQQQVDIVEVPDWTGFSSFLNVKCPVIVKLHGSDTYFCHLEQRKVKWRNRFLEKRALKKADGIISVSHYTAELTLMLFNLKKTFSVIANAIDVNNFKPNSTENKNKILLYFGTLIRKKGLMELPLIYNLVIEKHPNVKLVLVGKDANDIRTGSKSTWSLIRPLFNQQAMQNVENIGVVPYEKIKSYISKASICIFPSFAEAFPVSWLEAMSLSKPIVASNIGWANELVLDGITGFLIDPKNHQQFAKQISGLIEDEDLCYTFGKAGREHVLHNFSTEVIAKKHVDYYNSILKTPNNA